MLPDESHNQKFVEEAALVGISGVKGHRLMGGIRASMYNAMPQAGAEALLSFMKDFEMSFS